MGDCDDDIYSCGGFQTELMKHLASSLCFHFVSFVKFCILEELLLDGSQLLPQSPVLLSKLGGALGTGT